MKKFKLTLLRRILCLAVTVLISVNSVYALAYTTTRSRTVVLHSTPIQPLIDELAQMSEGDIERGIAGYNDVRGHWAEGNIGKMTNLGILTGGDTGKFNPDGDMSIAAFLKVVILATGGYIEQAESGTPWYTPYVEQALGNMLIEEDEFTDYTKPITREQAGKILYMASGFVIDSSFNEADFMVMRSRIKDYSQASERYRDSFVGAYVLGFFILGDSMTCNPKGIFTRAQACTTVMRLLDESMRPEFEIMENEYYLDEYGVQYYPKGSADNVKAINVLFDALAKSSGYADASSTYDSAVGCELYGSWDEMAQNLILGMDVGYTIYNVGGTDPLVNYFVQATIIDYTAYKDMHELVMEDLFKYLFDADYKVAMAEIGIVAGSADMLVREVKINDRYIIVYGNSEEINIMVTPKDGLLWQQFTTIYPDYKDHTVIGL